MPNTRDMDMSNVNIQAVIIGSPGSGKTFLAATFPKPNFIDFDGKVGVVRNPDFIRQHGLKSIEYGQFTEKSRYLGIASNHNAYDDACRYFDLWMSPAKRDTFATWIIDSGTSLIEFARNKSLIVLGGKSQGEKSRSKTFDTAMRTGVVMMQQQDWGGERSLTEQFIRMVKDSGKNLLVNVHQRESYNEGGILVSVKPYFTGQSVEIIPAMFKDVWHLKVFGAAPNNTYILTAENNGIYATRSELGLGVIENPTYDRIIARILEKQSEAVKLATETTSVPATLTA